VHHELFKLAMSQVSEGQGSSKMLGNFLIDRDRGRAANADDATITASEVLLPAPNFSV
jgi:hypothetical protein